MMPSPFLTTALLGALSAVSALSLRSAAIPSLSAADLALKPRPPRPRARDAAAADAPPLLRCCEWQAAHCATNYGGVRDWYDGESVEWVRGGVTYRGTDEGNWGVDYATYRDGFARPLAAELADLAAGSAVYESAVGAGWLLRGIDEALDVELRYAGNDVSEAALASARRDLPKGSFAVGDSLNLTWVDAATFDAVLCGFVDTIDADAAREKERTGAWVGEMTRLAKPGALIVAGNVEPPKAIPAPPGGLYAAATGADGVNPDWWRACAASDEHGWGVDPDSVRIRPLDDRALIDAWGERYSVFMRRRCDA